MPQSSSRLERNRELIEKSAALLAAGYPLDVLIARICGVIASAFDSMCFVALPHAENSVKIISSSSPTARLVYLDELPREDAPVAQILRGSGALLMRRAGDWDPVEAPEFISAVFVPVQYGDRVLGVVGVQNATAEQFDRDDVRLLETVARYLALPVRNQSAALGAVPMRYPWYTVTIIAVLALLSSIALGAWAHNRASEAFADAAMAQGMRLAHLESVLAPSLETGARYAKLGATLVGPVSGDRNLAETLLQRLLRSSPREIFGLGAFYGPWQFDRTSVWYGAYFDRPQGRQTIVRGLVTNVYAKRGWYRLAKRAAGDVAFTDPYVGRGVGYVSAVVAFDQNGSQRGVVLVDFLTTSLTASLRDAIALGDWAYVTNQNGRRILSSGSPIDGSVREVAMPLEPAHWTVHLVAPYATVLSEARRMYAWGIGLIVAIWAVAIAILGFVNVTFRARRDAIGLKLQRAELQNEIATRIDAEERLRSAAYHDGLTGLPNRTFFLDRLAGVLERRTATEYAVLFIDLDRFYVVNDIMGHRTGDALLRAIAARFEEMLPPHALFARLGGDEFVLLYPTDGPAIREAVAIAEKILRALRTPFVIEGREVFSNASVGIVHIDDSYRNAETVLRDADLCVYHAKRAGRARYAVFDRTMRDRVTHRLELESGLRGAVERKEFVPHYQPIVRVSDGTIVGFEALARWNRGGSGTFVSAGEFIGVAEQTGMLRAIDAALFLQICADAKKLLTIDPDLRFSVNVSATDLTRPSLMSDIDATLQRFGLSPRNFKMEITETAVMDDTERSLAVLGEMRARGFEITVDDFGVGYSSLSYLQRLPISGVKIDRSFIVALPIDGQALEIARAIIALAKTLGLSVTAEGVERLDQFEALAEMGVDSAQGYWCSPAVGFEAAESFLREPRSAVV